jgi:DNA-binding CsgD family transcriptional regulator
LQTKVENWIIEAIDLINASNSAQDYCRRLTLHPVLGKGMVGNHLFALTSTGRFQKMGSYGIYPYDESLTFNQFESNPLAASVRSTTVVREPIAGSEFDVQVCTGLKSDVANGVLMTILERNNGGGESFVLDEHQVKGYFLTLGLFISSAGFNAIDQATRDASGESLTERQFEVLMGMAMGKTNLQIANEQNLSESAIKQETVKIYRSLGVKTRQQAVGKAKALGLLPPELKIVF